MRSIAIIDYGMGNLRSVQKGLERVGYAAEVTRDPARIEAANGVVLPGVGAFGACMDNLRAYGLIDTVRRVITRGTPFLGICLGMQLLFDESEEFGRVPGLGIFPGRVVRFPETPALKVPHMGWNQIRKQGEPPHLRGIDDGAFVYFVHSYYVVPADPEPDRYDDRVRHRVHLRHRTRQRLCGAIPPREEPDGGFEDPGEFRRDRRRNGNLP